MSLLSYGAEPKLAQLNHAFWTSREGAPLQINCVSQAPDGSLWIGSGSGLYRFDGIHFTLFHEIAGEAAFPAIDIQTLYTAPDGTLWIGFYMPGIVSIRNGRVRVYTQANGLPYGNVPRIVSAPDGSIWAVARNQLVHLVNNRWQEAGRSVGLAQKSVYELLFDKEGTLWIAAGDALYALPKGHSRVQLIELLTTAHDLRSVSRLVEATDGSLWISESFYSGEPDMVKRLPIKGFIATEPVLIRDQAISLIPSSDGSLWILSITGGVWRVRTTGVRARDSRSGLLVEKVSTERFTRGDGLTSNYTFDGIEDKAGNVWIATDRGLDRFRTPDFLRFVDYPLADSAKLAACPQGGIWMADNGTPLLSYQDGRTVAHGPVRDTLSIYCDHRGVVWLNDMQGLWKYQNGRFTHVPYPPGIEPESARKVEGEDENQLYISFSRKGVWRLSNGKWNRVSPTAVTLFEDSHTALWEGFPEGGIARLFNGTSRRFLPDEAGNLGSVEAFCESHWGLLAGGTSGVAILRGNRFQKLVFADPASVRGVSGIVESHDGDVWLNSVYGVVRIPNSELAAAVKAPAYRIAAQSLTEDGVVGPSNQNAYLPTAVSSKNGTLWFATSGMVVSLDPRTLRSEVNPPTPTIQSFSADNVQQTSANPRLSPEVHVLRIGYFAVNLTAPERVIYRYRLDGEDAYWQDVGHRTEAVYTGLKPGRYTFHVESSLGNGVWSESQARMSLRLLPPWWNTWWCWTFTVGACVLTAVSLYRVRLHHLTEQLDARFQDRLAERTRIAQELHDTLLQSFQGLMLRFQTVNEIVLSDPAGAREDLEKALARADQALAEGRQAIQGIRGAAHSGTDIAQGLRELMSELVEEAYLSHGKSPSTLVIVEGQPETVNPWICEEVCRIAQEALRNSFTHSNAEHVESEVAYSRAFLRLRFRDDGIGIDPAVLQSGGRRGHWGLSGMRERATAIQGHLSIWSRPEAGTEIELTIPAYAAYETVALRSLFRISKGKKRANHDERL